MFCDFNSIFNKPRVDWTKVKLVENSPCRNCEHMILLRQKHPGNTWDAPGECNGCKKRVDWILKCLYKLDWYEKQEKQNEQKRNN